VNAQKGCQKSSLDTKQELPIIFAGHKTDIRCGTKHVYTRRKITGIYTSAAAFRATTIYSNCCKNTQKHSCHEGRHTLQSLHEDIRCQQKHTTHI